MRFDLQGYMGERLGAVEAALAQAVAAEGGPPRLVEAMGYSLLAGGKRLRPIMLLAAAEIFAVPRAVALPAACAVELVHTYSLIHDDLPAMDDDDLRRGRATSHKVFGEAMAILAGDALLTRAFGLLTEAAAAGAPPAAVVAAVAELSRAAGQAGMVGGQVEDLTWEGRDASGEVLQQIHARKTGAIFAACLTLGALLGGASAADQAALAGYARHFGLAFQITDDVLDVAGSAEALGKPVGSDERRDKSTYVKAYGLEGARRRAGEAAKAAEAAVARFGERAAPLVALARYVVARDR